MSSLRFILLFVGIVSTTRLSHPLFRTSKTNAVTADKYCQMGLSECQRPLNTLQTGSKKLPLPTGSKRLPLPLPTGSKQLPLKTGSKRLPLPTWIKGCHCLDGEQKLPPLSMPQGAKRCLCVFATGSKCCLFGSALALLLLLSLGLRLQRHHCLHPPHQLRPHCRPPCPSHCRRKLQRHWKQEELGPCRQELAKAMQR